MKKQYSTNHSEPQAESLNGLQKWILEYKNSIKEEMVLQREIDESIKNYDIQSTVNEKQGDPDEWTVVGKSGKAAGFKQKESVITKLEQKLQNDREKLLPTFYSNQERIFRKQHLMKLKKKYVEDNKKIENIKKNRKFKPF